MEENVKRLLCKHSRSSANTDGEIDSDIATLKLIRKEEEIHRFGEWAGVYESIIDVTELSAVEAAREVKAFVQEVLRKITAR